MRPVDLPSPVAKRHRRSLWARLREARIVARAALDERRPMLVHIVPIRRCNLACTYCNEFDDVSEPVPLGEMIARIDRLAELGTAVVTISGGEPLLHPELDAILRHIHRRDMVSTLITNGYKLTPKRIASLNAARLDRLQISIDNVEPDEVSKKSLKVLDKKLRYLAEHAVFDVNINSVIGANVDRPDDALTIAQRARSFGFTATMGVIHDDTGHLKSLSPAERRVFDAFQRVNRFSITRFNATFQTNLANGKPNDWRCRAGARYLYVCEDGLVHYCSQQRGYPGAPLRDYGPAQMRAAQREEKPCAPFCTIACVHQASAPDRFRARQGAPAAAFETHLRRAAAAPDLVTLRVEGRDARTRGARV
jgi:MoaA/NifB/PqqE/SkfB family radical SAM enzyme